jgi:DNA-binding response OmpR family regulator
LTATLKKKMMLQQESLSRFNFVLQGPLMILAVDDDPIMREFSTVYLSSPSVSVMTASSAEEGLALLAEHAFDIALVDVDMPGMSGLGMLKAIRSEPRHDDLPVMIITGREDMQSIDLAYECGATAFMCKPVNWRLLSHQVKFMLRAHRALRLAESSHA